jgi:hypothetical protein
MAKWQKAVGESDFFISGLAKRVKTCHNYHRGLTTGVFLVILKKCYITFASCQVKNNS